MKGVSQFSIILKSILFLKEIYKLYSVIRAYTKWEELFDNSHGNVNKQVHYVRYTIYENCYTNLQMLAISIKPYFGARNFLHNRFPSL